MKGKHHIIVESPRLKYEFDIKRNITIIQGDSATGKTTLVDLIRDYAIRGKASPIRIESDVPCEVFNGTDRDWRITLQTKAHSIIFIDEGYTFISTKEFAETVRETDNYYVLITRRSLPCLPYSIFEIYGIRTSGKYHFPEQVYHEFYPIYGDTLFTDSGGESIVVAEDSKSGFLFLRACCENADSCISAEGNSNVYKIVRQISKNKKLIVVADGAAFGAFIANILTYAQYRKNILIYLPESFEWIILKSGIITSGNLQEILSAPEEYIDSTRYFSWERFFADYLEMITKDDAVRRYQKQSLGTFYTEGKNKEQILAVFPEEIRKCIRKM